MRGSFPLTQSSGKKGREGREGRSEGTCIGHRRERGGSHEQKLKGHCGGGSINYCRKHVAEENLGSDR